MDKNKFSTGMLTTVWQVHRTGNQRVDAAAARLIHIEHRLDKAAKLLQKIEHRAMQAQEEIERSERRFNALQDSFRSLQAEWKTWKKQQDKT